MSQIAYKTLPGPKINRLELGGPPGKIRDRIFISSGAEIRGYSKKGKEFLNFNSNLTEQVKTM